MIKTSDKEVTIPRFSIKSSLLLLLAGVCGGILMPYIFSLVNLDPKLGMILFLPAFISFAIAYGQCFIETKDGFCKRFWLTAIIGFFILTILSYFWLFKGFVF